MKHVTCLLLVAVAFVSTAHAPVVFWIHGGGWQGGNKSMVGVKPTAFTQAGFVFVSINSRLLPTVDMGTLTSDVATALGWVHKHIGTYGGDPGKLLVMGHSAGGQLAALMSPPAIANQRSSTEVRQ